MTRKRTTGKPARSRSANWTDRLDSILLGVLKEQYLLGNCVGGTFKQAAWRAILLSFNQQSGLHLDKDNLQNRLKVLKGTFRLYYDLASRNGWGWDDLRHVLISASPTDWEAAIAVNPKYEKCRNRPFPAYKDMQFILGKSTAIVKHGNSYILEEDDDEGDGDDDDDDDDDDGSGTGKSLALDPIQMSGINIRERGATTPSIFGDLQGTGPMFPGTPLSVPLPPQSPISNPHANPHTPAESPDEEGTHLTDKRRSSSSIEPSKRRRKRNNGMEILSELVLIGKKRMEREIAERPQIFSVKDCLDALQQIDGLSNEAILVACDAFRDVHNRDVFMYLNGPLRAMWVQRQLELQSVLSRQSRSQFFQQQHQPPDS